MIRKWSLTRRLVTWYALSTSLLIFGVFQYMIWSFGRTIDIEDDQLLDNDLKRVERAIDTAASRPGRIDVPRLDRLWEGRDFEPVSLRILNDQGRILYQSGDFPQGLDPRSGMGTVELPAGQSLRVRTQDHLAPAIPGAHFTFQIALDRTNEDVIFAGHRRMVYSLTGISILMTVLLGNLIIRRGIRPLQHIVDAVQKVGPTTLRRRIPETDLPPELTALARTFNETLGRLEESFDRVSHASNDIAHELRTPINVIRGEIEVALSRPRSAEEYRDTLSAALEETLRVTEIIDSLLFLARSEGQGHALARDVVDVSGTLGTLREFYDPMASEEGISLELDVQPELCLSADRTLFQQATGNLLHNAIIHAGRGSLVRVSARRQPGGLEIVVRDDGVGIPAADLPRIFERFYQVDASRTGKRGTGLGLAITRSIVELHGGRIATRSAPGRGTSVTMTFPLPAEGKS